jgi:hypothetical protein
LIVEGQKGCLKVEDHLEKKQACMAFHKAFEILTRMTKRPKLKEAVSKRQPFLFFYFCSGFFHKEAG